MRSATASAWVKDSFPFRKARFVNSPGPAGDAPAGCLWASPEEAAGRYALPGAFKAYRPLLTGGR